MLRHACYVLSVVIVTLGCGIYSISAASEVDDLVAKVLDTSKPNEERTEAVGELGDMAEEASAAVSKLIPMIHDKALGIAVIEALGDIGEASAPAVPEILKAMKIDGERAEAGAYALGGIGPGSKDGIPALVEALDNPKLAVAATWSLGMIGPESKSAVEKLCTLIQSPNSSVRKNAIFALGRIGPPAKSALPLLLIYAKIVPETNDDRALRDTAIEAVVHIGPDAQRGLPLFLQMIRDSDWMVRAKAVEGIGKLGHSGKDASPELIRMLKTGGDRGARKAFWALQQIEPDEKVRVTVFMDLVRSGTGGQLSAALNALAEIGPGALSELMQYAIELDLREVEHPEDGNLKIKSGQVRDTLNRIKQQIMAEAERLRKAQEGKTGQAPNAEDEKEEKDAPPAKSDAPAPGGGTKAIAPPAPAGDAE